MTIRTRAANLPKSATAGPRLLGDGPIRRALTDGRTRGRDEDNAYPEKIRPSDLTPQTPVSPEHAWRYRADVGRYHERLKTPRRAAGALPAASLDIPIYPR